MFVAEGDTVTSRKPIAAVLSGGISLGGGSLAVMGILNLTPDSFSDGGKWAKESDAVAHAVQMYEQGAAIVDVGGESTRPGATRVDKNEEWRRVGAVLSQLVKEGVPVSVDTLNSDTAERALQAGAVMINDVSGGSVDPNIRQVCAKTDVAFVVQHWRGFPSDPNLNLKYGNVVDDLVAETAQQVDETLRSGVDPKQIIVDPGLGFSLDSKDSWRVVDSLETFVATGYPVLVGGSRKRFIADRYGNDVEQGTLEVTRRCVEAGVWMVRVHLVAPTVRLIQEMTEGLSGKGSGNVE